MSTANKSWLKGSAGIVLLLIVVLVLGGGTAWQLASHNNRSAWNLQIEYDLGGTRRVENFPYAGTNDALDAFEKVEAKGGNPISIHYGNAEMGIEEQFDPDFLRQLIRQRSR